MNKHDFYPLSKKFNNEASGLSLDEVLGKTPPIFGDMVGDDRMVVKEDLTTAAKLLKGLEKTLMEAKNEADATLKGLEHIASGGDHTQGVMNATVDARDATRAIELALVKIRRAAGSITL